MKRRIARFFRAMPSVNESFYEKYSRQILFAGIGEEGQKRLLASSAVVVGCGAIGAAAANLLARAGVGRLRVVDRDFVRSEEHTSELQSLAYLLCRLLLEKTI